MPSRRVVALIGAFWLFTSAYVAYRDLWPVFFASGPPPVAIDLADEAAQSVPVRWTIRIAGQTQPSKLITQMKYNDADDTFTYTSRYTEFRYEMSGISVVVPELTTMFCVTRDGNLREQSMDGKLEMYLADRRVGTATATVHGTVTDGMLSATCDIKSTLGYLKKSLDPLPVPIGQPLNPLLPVNRISGLSPGRRWVVHETDPLGEALAALIAEQVSQFVIKLPARSRDPLIGHVLSGRQVLDWHGESVSCYVIDYRREELVARTWARESDGKVLKQEAFKQGEHMTIERER